ncbi:hypothetical protein YC2023_122154 [Brassica napus]
MERETYDEVRSEDRYKIRTENLGNRKWICVLKLVAASDHKVLLFLFYFLCGASTPNDNCAQNQTNPGLVVLRFLIKSGWGMVSFVLFSKICVILRSKPLESTIKTKSDER